MRRVSILAALVPALFGQALQQINSKNVTQLRRAWTYHTGETGRQFECTPLVVGNAMYVSTKLGKIIALEADTGKLIWS